MNISRVLIKYTNAVLIYALAVLGCGVYFNTPLHAAFKYPDKPHGRVADTANTLSIAQVEQLEVRLEGISRKTNTQVVIVTLPSLQGEVVEDVAVNIFQKWGIGDKANNKGLLLLVSQQERSIRIEVGYGLEAVITDLISSRIIREELVPNFKSGQYYKAYISFLFRVESLLSGEVGVKAHPKKSKFEILVMAFAIILLLGLIALLQPPTTGSIISSRGTMRNSPRSYGGFGGGGQGGGIFGGFGGGFGGGMSGGGGASGNW